MTTAVLLVIIFLLISMNLFFWRTGSVKKAEELETILDKPLMDPKERRAIKKRIRRWKEEGKLTTSEYDTFMQLCESEWDGSDESDA